MRLCDSTKKNPIQLLALLTWQDLVRVFMEKIKEEMRFRSHVMNFNTCRTTSFNFSKPWRGCLLSVNPHGAMGFHTNKTLLTRMAKLAVKTPWEVLPAEDITMSSTIMAEIIEKLKTPILLLEVVGLLHVECREEDMIGDEAMVLVDATLTHMSELLVVMVMSLMTITVFHILVLLHMVMTVVMTIMIKMIVKILQE